MDQANPFESRTTYRLHRAEYLVLSAVAIALFVVHIHQVRWLPAVALFVYIDLIGYLPGAIAWHRSSTMHSLITQSAVIALWGLFVGWEWALLAIPIHLFGDRGLFGNFLKPFNLSFEPTPHPAYLKLRAALESRSDVEPMATDTPKPSRTDRQAAVG
jgi:hypothetical protein